jgi:hypothetical protein
VFECGIKIVAMGFVIEPGSYLRDPWNWLDFIVVVTSLLPLSSNSSSLRTVRLFKPLKSLNAIPSMKKLLNTILDSLLSLVNILALMAFFFIIFAILSVNLWKGTAHQHCRLTPVPVDGIWPVLPNYEHLCGGSSTCPTFINKGETIGSFCGTNYINYSTLTYKGDTANQLTYFADEIFPEYSRDIYNA